jgi:hypothetical protein
MSSLNEIREIINYIQPYYEELNKNYSESYLKGSIWYVGKDLNKWWDNCNNIRYFEYNKFKLKCIIEIILLNKKNNRNNKNE